MPHLNTTGHPQESTPGWTLALSDTVGVREIPACAGMSGFGARRGMMLADAPLGGKSDAT